MPIPFENANEFIDLFHIEEPYFSPTPLVDRNVAFSVQREYPQDSRYVPPKTQNGTPNVVAIAKIVYEHPAEVPELYENNFDPDEVKLRVHVAMFDRYLANHIEHNEDDPDSPTQAELERSRRTPEPQNINFSGDFTFNHSTNQCTDTRGDTCTPQEFLDHIFSIHFNTVHRKYGRSFRIRSHGHTLLFTSLQKLENSIEWVLKKHANMERKGSVVGRMFTRPKPDEFEVHKKEEVDFQGIKTTISSVNLVCLALIIGAIISYYGNVKIDFLVFVAEHPLLQAAFVVLLFAVLDRVLPRLLIKLLEFLHRAKMNVLTRGVTIRSTFRGGAKP